MNGSQFSQQGLANLYDISEGGIQIRSTKPAVVHSLLRIDIHFDHFVMPVIGEAIWSKQVVEEDDFHYRVGIAFREVDEKYRDILSVMCAADTSSILVA